MGARCSGGGVVIVVVVGHAVLVRVVVHFLPVNINTVTHCSGSGAPTNMLKAWLSKAITNTILKVKRNYLGEYLLVIY